MIEADAAAVNTRNARAVQEAATACRRGASKAAAASTEAAFELCEAML